MAKRVQRAHYRIVYPTAARPRLLVDDLAYDVYDCSEWGLRFEMLPDVRFEVGQQVTGVVHFRTGAERVVEGTVIRIQGDSAALHLTAGIPFRIILDEQRDLRRRYLDL